jgi:MoxR-like ATPase
MSDWKIFKGDRTQHDEIKRLPDPPSWRSFVAPDGKKKARGEKYKAGKEEIELVNAALYLRRPLMVTGKPGIGKTSLAYAVAYELGLGEVLYWPITTRTTLKDGLYNYDAIGRAQDTGISRSEAPSIPEEEKKQLEKIKKYLQLGPLGTAFLPSECPRILLIDEIDKSDIDLPNDLLHLFEEGRFEIPELVRISETLDRLAIRTAHRESDEHTEIVEGKVKCTSFPLIILTSNGERDFPPAFLRRCLRLIMQEPSKEDLAEIVTMHLGTEPKVQEEAKKLIDDFVKLRSLAFAKGDLATDQLLNAIYLLSRDRVPVGDERKALLGHLLKYLSSAEDA